MNRSALPVAALLACAAAWAALAGSSAGSAWWRTGLLPGDGDAVAAQRVSPDAQTIIAVARDVSPELVEMLEQARASDEAAFTEAVARAGKRLMSLAVLRQNKPGLYALRIEELRVQGALDAAATAWTAARGAGGELPALEEESRVRTLAGTLVDLNLRSRAMELAEIDAVLRTMRTDLERDARRRDQTVDDLVTGLRQGMQEALLGGRTSVQDTRAQPNAPAPADPARPGGPAKDPAESQAPSPRP